MSIMPHELYPFRYRDPLTGKWVRARYVAQRHVIAERYAEWEFIGPAEIRTRGGGHDSFNPFHGQPMRVAHLPANDAPAVAVASIDDQLERFLVLLFLRRYVTWCARRQRFAAMEGAERLSRSINEAS
jgi:hypothetical protein